MRRASPTVSDTAPDLAVAKKGGEDADLCVGCGLCGGQGRKLISPDLILRQQIDNRSAERRSPVDH